MLLVLVCTGAAATREPGVPRRERGGGAGAGGGGVSSGHRHAASQAERYAVILFALLSPHLCVRACVRVCSPPICVCVYDVCVCVCVCAMVTKLVIIDITEAAMLLRYYCVFIICHFHMTSWKKKVMKSISNGTEMQAVTKSSETFSL